MSQSRYNKRLQNRLEVTGIPVDGETSDSWLLGQDAPVQLVVGDALWRVLTELLVQVVVVDVVSNADKLAVLVRACNQDHSNANNVAVGDQLWLGSIGLCVVNVING